MWSPLTGGDGDVLTAMATQFSQENGMGITVNHVPQPDYMLSLNNAAGSPDELPEMTVARVINVAELAARGILQPYSDELMTQLGLGASDFPENLWVRGEYQGQRYSIPWDEQVLVMYYNKDAFQAAQVTEPQAGTPWTNEEFTAALDKLKNAGGGIAPIVIGNGFQAGTLFQTMIVQLGGAISSEDGTKATYNTAQGVQALKDLVALRDKGLAGVSGTGDPEVNTFKQKQAAIVFHGPWHISGMKQVTDFKVGFAPVPQLTGDNYAVWAGSHQMSLVTKDPAKQAAAVCWVRWASDHSVTWATAGNFPARTSQREDSSLPQIAPEIANVAAVVDKGIILPTQPGLEGALWGSGFGPVVDRALAGEITADQYQTELDTANAQSQQLIDQNLQQYGGGASPGTSGSPGASGSP
jgi:multiple sugar transport system substrate-binding protein